MAAASPGGWAVQPRCAPWNRMAWKVASLPVTWMPL
jgi:hypothetical protein